MEEYDQIIVGAGITGLTASLLLGLQGNRVLLVEENEWLGGSVARFRRSGIPFDVGFHFTGGFGDGRFGMLGDMLRVLGIRDRFQPIFYPENCSHEVAFTTSDTSYSIPQGIRPLRQKLKADFPSEKAGIDDYFDRFMSVCNRTASMNVQSIGQQPPVMDEDYLTLQDVLDEHLNNEVLQALLSSYCTCHGTAPDTVPFSSHSRVTAGMQESTASVVDGGAAFVDAFKDALNTVAVDVRCGSTIESLEKISDGRVGEFVLSSGDTVKADACLFTINPKKVLETLPDDHLTPAFQNRIDDFEPTLGFFSLFGRMKRGPEDIPEASPIRTLLPGTDFNRMMQPVGPEDGPTVVIFSKECVDGEPVQSVVVLEVSFFERVQKWEDSLTGRRGDEYAEYKTRRCERVVANLASVWPEFATDFELLDSASMLTFRDYLNNPFGAAYGIQQKVGQFNLVGKLPLVNLYAAGQSALLPGVVGAMASAFVVCRSLIGKTRLEEFIEKQLCH